MSADSVASERPLEFVDPATFHPHFAWRKTIVKNGSAKNGEEVFCEGVALTSVAKKFGTPAYLYSESAFMDAYRELDLGLNGVPHTVCYAVKANGNLSILSQLAKQGSGFDIVSGGELEHLRRIGVRGDRIVFSGVGKSREEIRTALEYSGAVKKTKSRNSSGILLFNVESEAEFEILLEESERSVRRGNLPTAAAVRVNPDVQAGGHPHIATGRYHHKFGLDWQEAKRLYLQHKESRFLRWQGISAHIGSQIVSLEPFQRAFERVAGYVRELQAAGISLRYLDFGGGLGVRYTDETIASREEYARMVADVMRPLGLHLLLEPGRAIIAAAGVLLTRVIYTKVNRGKSFVIVDAAMNDLLRPALYAAIHPITRVTRVAGEENAATLRVDIVGPVCETGDCLLRDWPLGEVKPGDLLAIWTSGAYGMTQASNYNGRVRACEVLVQGARAKLIRRRETQGDLLRTDVLGAQKMPRRRN
jgi:diaminopimelate decarboxylase